jgi:hypothetical protein
MAALTTLGTPTPPKPASHPGANLGTHLYPKKK